MNTLITAPLARFAHPTHLLLVCMHPKCDSCKSLLLSKRLFDIGEFADVEQSHVNVQLDIHRNLLQFADRGGLVPPSEYTYAMYVLAFAYFQQIECNVSLMSRFMQSSNQCAIFLSVVHHMLCSSACMSTFCDMKCSNNHMLFSRIVMKMFNCFAKNSLKRINIHTASILNEANDRKIRKLTSKYSQK